MTDKTIVVGDNGEGVTVFGVIKCGKLILASTDFQEAREEAGWDAQFEDWMGRPLIHPSELERRLKG